MEFMLVRVAQGHVFSEYLSFYNFTNAPYLSNIRVIIRSWYKRLTWDHWAKKEFHHTPDINIVFLSDLSSVEKSLIKQTVHLISTHRNFIYQTLLHNLDQRKKCYYDPWVMSLFLPWRINILSVVIRNHFDRYKDDIYDASYLIWWRFFRDISNIALMGGWLWTRVTEGCVNCRGPDSINLRIINRTRDLPNVKHWLLFVTVVYWFNLLCFQNSWRFNQILCRRRGME
jgi:hypothetical protein